MCVTAAVSLALQHCLTRTQHLQVVAMCVAPNLRAVALCEVLHSGEHGSAPAAVGGGAPAATPVAAGGEGKLADEPDESGQGSGAGQPSAAAGDAKSQVSVYHVASRRKMRTMSLPLKGGVRVLSAVCRVLPFTAR